MLSHTMEKCSARFFGSIRIQVKINAKTNAQALVTALNTLMINQRQTPMNMGQKIMLPITSAENIVLSLLRYMYYAID